MLRQPSGRYLNKDIAKHSTKLKYSPTDQPEPHSSQSAGTKKQMYNWKCSVMTAYSARDMLSGDFKRHK